MTGKKHILIFPPSEFSGSVNLALPSLCAQLRKANRDTHLYDFNIEFCKDVLNKETVENAINKINEVWETLEKNKSTFYGRNNSQENKLLSAKYDKIKAFIENNKYKNVHKILNYLDKSLNIINSDTYFNKRQYIPANEVIEYALEIIFMPYAPVHLKYGQIIDYSYPITYDYLKQIIFDERYNIFLEYYKKKLEPFFSDEPDMAGISIGYPSQLLAGFTIGYLLKKHTKAHVTIGGALISRKIPILYKNLEIFDLFIDSAIQGEGEYSITELAKYINNEIDIKDVHNLVYKKDGRVISNPKGNNVLLSKMAIPDFSDLDLRKYFSPDIVLPLEIQRSCYWGKCSFCDINYEKSFSAKNIDTLIEEIKHYKEKYNASNFIIVDSAMPPSVLSKFSDAVLKNKLDIKFFCDVRMEPQFTYDLLKKAYDAGLRCAGWGIESVNPRISKLMNKNIDLKNCITVLKNADKTGIWNTVYIIIGFPTETKEEALENINFLKSHRDIIHSVCLSEFTLVNYSDIYCNYKKYGIETVSDELNFNITVNYTTNTGMKRDEITALHKEFDKDRKLFYEGFIHNCSYSQYAQYLLKFSLNDIKRMYSLPK